MLIWMRHPQHGRMDVYSQGEVDLAITRGWYVETAAHVTAPAVPVTATAAAVPEPAPEVPAATPEDVERAQLYSLADDLGIRVDRRWGLERLRKTVGV